jgi:hypothetical protein
MSAAVLIAELMAVEVGETWPEFTALRTCCASMVTAG